MRVLNNPYLSDITLQTPTRGSPYTWQALTLTNETLTVNQVALHPIFIDRADLAQSGYFVQMELAARQAAQLNEQIETYVWQQHTVWEDFDGTDIGGAAGSITVSITNVDDIIRNVRKLIFTGKGGSLLERNGGFFVWKPGDFEKVEAFAQANGFAIADTVLKNGIKFGFRYGGFDHYVSNRTAGGRCAAGVKKLINVGVLRSTYGQIMVDEKDPNSTSGVAIVSRVDYGVQTFGAGVYTSLVYDIAVA